MHFLHDQKLVLAENAVTAAVLLSAPVFTGEEC